MLFQNRWIGKNQWWRYLIVIASTFLGILAGQLPLIITIQSKKKTLELTAVEFAKFSQTMDFNILGIHENIALLLILIPFIVGFIFFIFSVKKVQHKPLLKIITGRDAFDWKRLLLGTITWFTLSIFVVFSLFDSAHYVYQFNLVDFLPLLLIALLLIPFQVAIEEIVFRGYLLQAFAFFTKYKTIPILATTLVFTLVHVTNPEFEAGIALLIVYLIPSLLFGMITILDDGLELPIGLHIGNNLFVALVLSTFDGAMKTPSIFRTEVGALVEILPLTLIILSVAVLLLFGKMYHWSFSELFKKHQ